MTAPPATEPTVSFASIQARPTQANLTLLIPTLGRDLLRDCLQSVLAGSLWPAEITVVDQGGSADIPRWLDEIADLGITTRYLPSSETGRARGLNQGLRAVATELVCITDDDCIVDKDWIKNLIAHLRAYPNRVVTGQILATGPQPVINTVRDTQASVASRPSLLFDRLSGGNFATSLSVFWHVGLFDDDPCLAFSEDGEWAYRALRRGIEIGFEPEASVYHRGWRLENDRQKQYTGYALSHAAFFGKYLRKGDLFIGARSVAHLVRAARRWVVGKAAGNVDVAANGRAYVSQWLPGLVRGLRSGATAPSLADADQRHHPGWPPQGANSIAVILLTIDQREQTLRCLQHLVTQRSQDLDFTVVVWDNGSTDGTRAAIADAFPEVRVFHSPHNLGVAGGRNAAARATVAALKPTLLLFLDNDMVVTPGFVAGLARPFFADSIGAVGQTQAKLRLTDTPQLLNDGGGCRLQFWLGRTRPIGFGEPDNGQFDQPTPCISCGGAMMVRADVFEALNGFDEVFNPFGPEDLDFSLRLQAMGLEAWYMPQAMAFHDVNHTFGSGAYSESYARFRANHWMRLMRRHANPVEWAGFLLVGAPIIALKVMVREGRKRNLTAIRGLIRGLFDAR